LYVKPLLCNDREIGVYNILVSDQRIGKHVPVATVTLAVAKKGYRQRGQSQGLRKKRKHNRSGMVAVLGPFEALPYYIHTYIGRRELGPPNQFSSAREAEKRWRYS
jgi:hypothetical protein